MGTDHALPCLGGRLGETRRRGNHRPDVPGYLTAGKCEGLQSRPGYAARLVKATLSLQDTSGARQQPVCPALNTLQYQTDRIHLRVSSAPRPLPLTVLLAALMVMAALHTVFPVANVVGDPWRLFGVAFIVLGGGLNIWADALFKSNRTTVKPFERSIALLDRGPFAYSRNPMYLGMVCVLAGVAVGLGSATPWVVVPVFVWQMHRRFIVSEEKMLDEAFGARYLEYKSKVRRWL